MQKEHHSPKGYAQCQLDQAYISDHFKGGNKSICSTTGNANSPRRSATAEILCTTLILLALFIRPAALILSESSYVFDALILNKSSLAKAKIQL
jgi:hypothetical protein